MPFCMVIAWRDNCSSERAKRPESSGEIRIGEFEALETALLLGCGGSRKLGESCQDDCVFSLFCIYPDNCIGRSGCVGTCRKRCISDPEYPSPCTCSGIVSPENGNGKVCWGRGCY